MGMTRWKRLFSSMEVLVGPTIQKALALRENHPTPKIHKTFVTAETMTKLKAEKTHTPSIMKLLCTAIS
jgi:hypothetical protein